MSNKKANANAIQGIGMNIIAFVLVCLLGYFIGSLSIYLGPFIKYIELGSTGGILITSLLLGYIGKIGFLSFRMDPKILGAIKEISLVFFLSIVGLRYGYDTINSLSGSGVILVLIAFVDGLLAIFSGYLLGRYVFKLNWIVLSGAICGGMTSTPGLGAAIDAADSDDVASGYGATYPFALLGMVIFTIILHRLV